MTVHQSLYIYRNIEISQQNPEYWPVSEALKMQNLPDGNEKCSLQRFSVPNIYLSTLEFLIL